MDVKDNYIGRLLDNRYEILEAIGSGGMALVYKARCHRLNRLVAIKILKDELSQDAEFRRRFHAESQAVAMLSHPNIVSVYDVSHSDNVDYIVMELIDGITLKQYMQQKGVLNWREALHFSTQIAKALEHAHSRGIIHRDIKPHNIMVLKDGSVKVADFGIARVSSAQSTLTREALGSVHYISPEQAKGSRIDYRSDLYSLGVVLYEMLTGRPPYDGETPVSVAIQHINAHAVPPRSINPQVPVGLEQITMRAMQADPDLRYESATDMLSDLEEFRRNPNVDFSAVQELPTQRALGGAGTRQGAGAKASHGKAPQTRDVRPSKRRSKASAATLVAGILSIALALAFIGYFLYSFFFADLFQETADIRVPNFVGKVAEDIDLNDYPNFRIQIGQWMSSNQVPMGQVMDQEPDANRSVKSGATITLIVSSGPSTDTMRNLVNYTEQNARTILDNLALDLTVMVEKESSNVYQKGAVIRTVPAAEEPLVSGQTVVLVVSTGVEVKTVPVPELVGKDIEAAKAELDSIGLKYGVTYVDGQETKGTVIFQSIKQLEEVREGTTINLQVSNGPKEEEKKPDPDQGNEEDKFPFHDPKIIMIPMPSGTGTVEVVIYLDGEEVERMPPLELVTVSDQGLPISISAKGVHLLEVYINGEPWHSMTYDFDTGEQVE